MACVPADDEPLGHAFHLLLDNEGRDRAGHGVGSGAEGEAETGRQFAVAGEEIFAGVAGDLVAGGQRGKGIDEAEEVGLEGGIAHRPVQHQALPIGGIEDARLVGAKLLVESAAKALDAAFQEDVGGVRHGGRMWRFRYDVHLGKGSAD